VGIEKTQVEYLASLARIELSEDELELFSGQLEKIVGYVEKLNELDLENVPPTSHTQNLKNVLREDTPKKGLTKDEALALAPDRQGDYFRVPRVIESD